MGAHAQPPGTIEMPDLLNEIFGTLMVIAVIAAVHIVLGNRVIRLSR